MGGIVLARGPHAERERKDERVGISRAYRSNSNSGVAQSSPITARRCPISAASSRAVTQSLYYCHREAFAHVPLLRLVRSRERCSVSYGWPGAALGEHDEDFEEVLAVLGGVE